MPQDAHRLEQAQRAERVGIGGVLGGLEADLDVALRRQIVDLVGLGLLDQADQVGGVGQVAVVQEEACLVLVRVGVEMVDPAGVERRGAPLDAVHDVALGQQKRREIGAVLAGDAGDQRDLPHHASLDCDSTETTRLIRLHGHRGRVLSQLAVARLTSRCARLVGANCSWPD